MGFLLMPIDALCKTVRAGEGAMPRAVPSIFSYNYLLHPPDGTAVN